MVSDPRRLKKQNREPTPAEAFFIAVDARDILGAGRYLAHNPEDHLAIQAFAALLRSKRQFGDAAEALARVPEETISILLQRSDALMQAKRPNDVISLMQPLLKQIEGHKRPLALADSTGVALRPLFEGVVAPERDQLSAFEENVRLQLAVALYAVKPNAEVVRVLRPLLDSPSHGAEAAQLSMVVYQNQLRSKDALLVPHRRADFPTIAPLRAVAHLALGIETDDLGQMGRALHDLPQLNIHMKDGLFIADLSSQSPRAPHYAKNVRLAEANMPNAIRLGEALFHAGKTKQALAIFLAFDEVMDKAIKDETKREKLRERIGTLDGNNASKEEIKGHQKKVEELNKMGFGKLSKSETEMLKRGLFSMGYVYHRHAVALDAAGQTREANAFEGKAFRYLLCAYEYGVVDSSLLRTLASIASASEDKTYTTQLTQCMHARDRKVRAEREQKAINRLGKDAEVILSALPVRASDMRQPRLTRDDRDARRPHRPTQQQVRCVR